MQRKLRHQIRLRLSNLLQEAFNFGVEQTLGFEAKR